MAGCEQADQNLIDHALLALDFLEAFNDGRLKLVTEKVVVVGGGDTSIDVASVARRLGRIENIADKDNADDIF